MIVAIMGFFKPGIDTSPAALQANFNEHLAQSFVDIRLSGPLWNSDGARIGWLALLDAKSFAEGHG